MKVTLFKMAISGSWLPLKNDAVLSNLVIPVGGQHRMNVFPVTNEEVALSLWGRSCKQLAKYFNRKADWFYSEFKQLLVNLFTMVGTLKMFSVDSRKSLYKWQREEPLSLVWNIAVAFVCPLLKKKKTHKNSVSIYSPTAFYIIYALCVICDS